MLSNQKTWASDISFQDIMHVYLPGSHVSVLLKSCFSLDIIYSHVLITLILCIMQKRKVAVSLNVTFLSVMVNFEERGKKEHSGFTLRQHISKNTYIQ